MLPVLLIVAAAIPQSLPYEVDPATDGLLTAGALGLTFFVHAAVKPSVPARNSCGGPCNADDLAGIDRDVLGKSSKAWRDAGDPLALGALGGAMLLGIIDGAMGDSPWADSGTEVLLTLEAAGLTWATSTALRFAFRRPRPAQYEADADLSSLEAEMSFPSGHVAAMSAILTSAATSFWLRHPDSPWRYVAAATAAIGSGVMGYGRIEAGKHFTTDVIAGAIVGGTIGFLVPYLHLKDSPVSVVPRVGHGGAGVVGVVAF